MLTLIIALKMVRTTKSHLDFDDLTGLFNLEKFKIEAKKLLSNAKPDEYSFICIDINKFQYLTDSLGRETANSVLRVLGEHFKKVVPEEAILCRRYSDNFVILLHETFGPIIEDYVLSMISVVSQLGSLLPLHYTLEFSTGVYSISNPHEDIELMINKANTARTAGKYSPNPSRISFYNEQMNLSSEHEKEIIFDMNRAFEANEFIPYYQPKFNFADGKVIGAEALVRWKHYRKGLLEPNYFVPLFERNGFISKVDIKIFESVCRFLDRWNKSGPEGTCPKPLTISCNLSRYQLYNPTFAQEYSKIASKYQIAPSKIELELTESLMMDNKKRLLKAMNEIKKAGFDISVDDFGSGFSSLSLLKDIPANVIKLDKEFFANTAPSNSDEHKDTKKDNIIVNSVIDMAKKLSMTTVAEGVEEESQARQLKEMGCDIAQGYFYAKPMCEEDFEKLLHNSLCK
ncbi:bifunctional diguanylate cyclase/phosphodiesterase [uncultured Treponema sp.]|uniref:putative bifunctional diguanylate cyclase/phosphodiesterase n=1 Tax=uncultured Treponema sp. TaxID=162155 RepID=UPI00260017BC|nr:bifunctional diguanylate cyclase/phosphodiesterase [uncultured Treponema sp.]